jgi:UDP-GlcNAc:undecaprenyl-phosphate GlcNAc-1-phosphate transferase
LRSVQFLASFLVALGISAAVLPLVIRVAHRVGAVDRPDSRRVHRGAVPRLGGVGIFLGFAAGVAAALALAGRVHGIVEDDYNRIWYGAALGLALIFVAGVLDDLFQFRAHTKLLFQVAAAGAAVATGLSIDAVNTPFGGVLHLGALGPVAAFAWILVVTNALNLVDGLDGLAGGLALIVTVTVALVALAMGQFSSVVLATALAGAVLGFLVYNVSPARIFMGDGGSQFLGYALALVSLRGSQKGPTAVAVLVPLLVLGVPLLDLGTTIVRRLARGPAASGRGAFAMVRTVCSADREHLHHNLLDLGLSPRRAVLALHGVGVLFAVSAYLTVVANSVLLAGFTLLLSLGAVVAIKIGRGSVRSAATRAAGPETHNGIG